MSQLVRREAICTLAGGVAALLGGSQMARAASLGSQADPQAVLATGTLTPDHVQGRKLIGFIETPLEGGQAFLSLVQQDPANPMIMSVFAAPKRQNHKTGVEVTVCFFAEPHGDVTFNLLHLGGDAAGARHSV